MSRVLLCGFFLCVGCSNPELEQRAQKAESDLESCTSERQNLQRDSAEQSRKIKALTDKLQVHEKNEAARQKAEQAALLGVKAGDKLYATIKTSMGTMVAELFWEQVPITVTNFVGLAEGSKPWTDPKTAQRVTDRPLYSGTIFHRVIPNFMIQGGDPLGNGRGGPGYKFEDEIVGDLRHATGGILSMANSGPNTNGSQFFITEKPTPHLDNRHTVFGKVIEGEDLVAKIARVAAGPGNRPETDVVIKKIVIGRGSPKR